MKKRILKTEKYLKLLAYTKNKIGEGGELFSKSKHPQWKIRQLFDDDEKPLQFSIFKVTVLNGTVVYAISDENGCLYYPDPEFRKNVEVEVNPLFVRTITQSKKYLKLLAYAKKEATPNTEVFSKKQYPNWNLQQLFNNEDEPLKLSVFKFQFDEGKDVYSVSDEEGYVYYPNDGVVKVVIEQEPTSIKNKIKYYATIGGVVFILLLSVFGKPIAVYFRELNDPLRVSRKKAIEKFNTAREALLYDWKQKEQKLEKLYIYTNDTTSFTAKLSPNLDIYDAKSMIDFVNLNSESYQIEAFLKRKDTLGYTIIVRGGDRNLSLLNLNSIKEEQEYIAISFNYYSEKIKEHLRKRIDKKPERQFRYPYKSKEEQYAKLEQEQFSKVIFTETELQNEKIKVSLKALFAPRINLKDTSYVFYITSYNTVMNKEELASKTSKFARLFMKSQDTTNCCTIKEVSISKHENLQ